MIIVVMGKHTQDDVFIILSCYVITSTHQLRLIVSNICVNNSQLMRTVSSVLFQKLTNHIALPLMEINPTSYGKK